MNKKLVSTIIVKPEDCNQYHNLFGGRLLSLIDEGAAIYAKISTKQEICVTKSFGQVLFNVPVPLGSIVYLYCSTVKEGRTSITIKAEVMYTKEFINEVSVAECGLVFVTVDNNNKPTQWNQNYINPT